MREFKDFKDLVEASTEEVSEYLDTLNITEITGIKKLCEIEYTRMESMKNDLNKQLSSGGLTYEQKESITKATNDLYLLMQHTENRATLVEEKRKNLSLKALN